jgi:hypothetical protein
MGDVRERLIRECFEHERDLEYPRFRQFHFGDPEVVRACPDPGLRERMLRGFWEQDAEKHYAGYCDKLAGMSTERLLDLRADLADRLDYLGLLEYREARRIAGGRSAANDNERGRE